MRKSASKLLFACILSVAIAAVGTATVWGASYNQEIIVDDGTVLHVPESSDITITDSSKSAMHAKGAGSTISADDHLTVDAYSRLGDAATADDGGVIRIGRSADITARGSRTRGLNSLQGSTISVGEGALIKTMGTYADAVGANDGGSIYIGNGSTIETNSYYAMGMKAISSGGTSFIKAGDDLSVTTYSNGNSIDNFDFASGIWAEGAGNIEIGDRLTVTTYGARSRGLVVYNGGSASVQIGDDGAISTYGHHAIGLWLFGWESSASFTAGDNLTIKTYYNQANEGNPYLPANPYDFAYGIYVEEGGSADIGNNLAVSTLGSNSHATVAYSSLQDAQLKMGKSADLATEGDNSYGLLAQYVGAVISADDGLKVTTAGKNSYGVRALSYGLIDIGGGARISTSGESASAALADAGGTLILGKGAVISTGGDKANALYSLGSGTRVYVSDDLSITTTGSSSKGVRAGTDSIVEIGRNADISTGGTSSIGVDVVTGARVIFGEGLKVNTAGGSAYGVYAKDKSFIEIDSGSQITTAGANAHAVYALGGGNITINGGKIAAGVASANAILAKGAYDAANYSQVSGAGVFSISGDIIAEADSSGEAEVALTLEDGSLFMGAAAKRGTSSGEAELRLELSGASTLWKVTGDSSLTRLTHNGAAIDFAGSALGTTITVDTLGGDGGLFAMKADMGGGVGDKLIVTDTSSGSYLVTVMGEGGSTADGTETLTIIETADDGAVFSMTSSFVDCGAWQYGFRAVSGTPGAWELYGTRQISTGASTAINTFAAGYLMGYAEMNTLVQRLGELRDTPYESGFWARIHGGKFNTDGMKQAGEFDLKYGGVHVGYDRKIETALPGDFYAGVMFGYSKGDIDFADAAGDGDADSKTLGIYGTYKGADGLYVDAVLKYQWIGHEFHTFNSSGARITTNDVDTGGFGFSVEAGKRFGLKNGWYFEPQAQLSYLKQDGGTFNMSNGPSVYSDGWTSLQGRLGLRVGYENGSRGFYAKVSWVKEFDGDLDFKVNGAPFKDSFGDNWWVYGVGYVSKVNERNSLYFDLERSSGGVFEQDWAIKAGWRIEF